MTDRAPNPPITAPGWAEVGGPGFFVSLPGKPNWSIRTGRGFGQPISVFAYELSTQYAAYAVEVDNEVPGDFDEHLVEIAGTVDGRANGHTAFAYYEHEGADGHVTGTFAGVPSTLFLRVIATDDSTYTLRCAVPGQGGFPPPPDWVRVVDSFRLR